MRVFRRLLRIFIIVLLLALASGGVMYHLSTRTPAAYARRLLSGEQRDAAAQRLETEKIPQILNMATEAQSKASSAYRAQSRGQAIPPGATQPTAPVTVSFSEDEINASLGKWSQRYGTGVERYLADPYIALEDGAIVLMGKVPEFDRVVSAQFQPSLDESGALHCELSSLRLGSLPLPESLFSKYRTKIETALRTRLPQWQNQATIDATGVANSSARDAALANLVLGLLNRQSTPAVLFLPKGSKTVPVRLTNVTVEKGALTITIRPMDAPERTALLEKIRQPQQSNSSTDAPKS
jgi:hypothetical protein